MAKAAFEAWFLKANDDLRWTKASITGKVWYGACFSAQQAVEKALKAYLISQNRRVLKVHSLIAILEVCIKLDTTFDQLRETCAILTDYYAPVRYPDVAEIARLSKQHAIEALELAEKAVDFVATKIKRE